MSFLEQKHLLFKAPVVENVPNDEDIYVRKRVFEEIAGLERNSPLDTLLSDVTLKHRPDSQQVIAVPSKMRVGARNLTRQPALRAANISKCSVLSPRKNCGDGACCQKAQSGHGLQELRQPFGIPIEHAEEVRFTVPALVLRKAGLEPFGQISPEPVEPSVHHLEHATNIG